jgi:radical SAM protein with 4Fe4S-binding SPASM domain
VAFDSLPFSLGWELTLACNIRCRHCASSAGRPRKDELTTEEALSLCGQFPELLVQEVAFTGGEPLLRSDWPTITEHLAKMGIATTMVTNGLGLDVDTLLQMNDVGLEALAVSVDGLEAAHDHLRGKEGLFRRTLTGIENARTVGIPVTVFTTVHGMNVGQLGAMYSLLQSVGVTQWQPQPIMYFGRSRNGSEIILSEQDYLELGHFFEQKQVEARENGCQLLPADGLGYYSKVDEAYPPWRGCSAGLSVCSITSNGKVKGCLSLPDHLVEGDLRENDLWDIWFHPDAFAYTRNFSIEDLGPNCCSCDMGEQCKGGCSAMSYSYTGRFHNDPYCFYAFEQRSERMDFAA